MARTKEEIKFDIQWEQDALNRALEQRMKSIERAQSVHVRDTGGWGNFGTNMAQGMLEDNAEKLYREQCQRINVNLDRLREELKDPEAYQRKQERIAKAKQQEQERQKRREEQERIEKERRAEQERRERERREEQERREWERRAAQEKKDKYDKLVQAKNEASTEEEYHHLAKQFHGMNGYADTVELASECDNQYRLLKDRRERKERKLNIAGRILQTGVFSTFLYILIGTEIVRGSVQSIFSISLALKIPDTVYLLPLILPLFFYALAIGIIRSVFLLKGKKYRFPFYIAAVVLQMIMLTMWIKASSYHIISQNELIKIIGYLGIALLIIIIPGKIIGAMKRKAATITLIIIMTFITATALSLNKGLLDNFSEKKNYADGMAAVKYGNFLSRKWGFIDENGKKIIPYIYSDVLSFAEGLAAVRIDNTENGKWGFIGKDGNEVIPFKYDAVESFSEGLAKVRIGNAENGKWGFIDRNGTEVVPCKYNSIGVFSEGLAAVKSDSKWGFIDKFGRIIISLKYDAAKSFSDGYAQVGKTANTGVKGWNFKWGLIDKRENLIIPYKYSSIGDFNGDLAVVSISKNESYVARNNKRYTRVVNHQGVVNKNGQEVISPANYYNVSIREDFIEVKANRNANIQYYDKSGNRVRK